LGTFASKSSANGRYVSNISSKETPVAGALIRLSFIVTPQACSYSRFILPFAPAVFPVLLKLVDLTAKTEPDVTAPGALAAVGAFPFFRFLFEETLHALFAYITQIFNHTQTVFRAVAFVERFQSFTRKIFALIAEPHKPLAELFADITHVQTVFAAGDASLAVYTVYTFLFQVVFPR